MALYFSCRILFFVLCKKELTFHYKDLHLTRFIAFGGKKQHWIAVKENYDSLFRLPGAFTRTVRSFRSAVLPSRKEITEVFGGLPRNLPLFFFGLIVARSQVQLKHTFVKRNVTRLYLVTGLTDALSALRLCTCPFLFPTGLKRPPLASLTETRWNLVFFFKQQHRNPRSSPFPGAPGPPSI